MASLVRTTVRPCSQRSSSVPPLAQQPSCSARRSSFRNWNDSSNWRNVNQQLAVSRHCSFASLLKCEVAPTFKEIKSISHVFDKLKVEGKVAVIPYLTAGDPNLETTAAAIKLLDNMGAHIIELGIPYSDPLADGPVIQAAATRSLGRGTTVDSVFQLIREVVPQIKSPIVVFVYYNQLLRRGLERFVEELKATGASGVVVPDLPLEDTHQLRQLTTAAGLDLVLLTTPTTPTDRMISITEVSQGFIYLVSLTGVTGARAKVEDRVEKLLKSIKAIAEKPVCVGFGISNGQQARQIADWGADGVIIGSAIVKLLGESGTPQQGLQAVEEFMSGVQKQLDQHR